VPFPFKNFMHSRLFHRVTMMAACSLVAFTLLWSAEVDPNRYLDDVKYLASKQLKGRGDGTPELEKAASFIVKQFQSMGLKPIPGNGYEQAFTLTVNAHPGPQNHFDYSENGKKVSLKLKEDFFPFNFSTSAKVSGQVVFAGYGITAPEYNYDDYAGIDAKDKVVLILRHEPQEHDENSIFSGRSFTQHAQFFSKATNAKNHGAKAVILVNDRPAHMAAPDEFENFGREVGPGDAGIPFVQMKAAIAEDWIREAGKNLDDMEAAIDKDLHPRSFELPAKFQVHLTTEIQRDLKTVHNVAAYLPGQTDEYVVIGAHYDHLGLGEQYSMAPSMIGQPHPGADDNASGTAGVIELARWFSARPRQKRGILFLTFAGEELGLLGSSFYVNHPELPLSKAVAMINMDMIGRIREGKVYVGGVPTGTTLNKILEEVSSKYNFKLDFSDTTGYGSSDHTSFTTKQIPILFFFSGLHADYHKPSDTWDKIDAPDAARLLDMIGDITERLMEAQDRPQFVRVAEPPHPALGAGGSASGYGTYFGSVPDFSESTNGVRFADIREGSPAAKAGLKGGDVLVEFDGKPIQNLYDFTYALRSKKPGDVAVVKVRRGSETIEVKVTLAERK
jgi:aminopeptidase YwaD